MARSPTKLRWTLPGCLGGLAVLLMLFLFLCFFAAWLGWRGSAQHQCRVVTCAPDVTGGDGRGHQTDAEIGVKPPPTNANVGQGERGKRDQHYHPQAERWGQHDEITPHIVGEAPAYGQNGKLAEGETEEADGQFIVYF